MSAGRSRSLYRSSGQFDPRGLNCRAQPVVQGGPGLPAQLLAGAGDVQAGALDLAGAGGFELRLELVAAALLLEDRDEVEHAGLVAGADIDGAAGLAVVRRCEVRRDDVADEHVVARLSPVAVDRGAPAVHEAATEDRDDAGLTERV